MRPWVLKFRLNNKTCLETIPLSSSRFQPCSWVLCVCVFVCVFFCVCVCLCVHFYPCHCRCLSDCQSPLLSRFMYAHVSINLGIQTETPSHFSRQLANVRTVHRHLSRLLDGRQWVQHIFNHNLWYLPKVVFFKPLEIEFIIENPDWIEFAHVCITLSPTHAEFSGRGTRYAFGLHRPPGPTNTLKTGPSTCLCTCTALVSTNTLWLY